MIIRIFSRYTCSLLLACTAIWAQAAAPNVVKATYDLSREGMQIGVVQEAFEKTGSKYRVTSDSTPVGALALFARIRIALESAGTVTAAGLRPDRYTYKRLDDASKNQSADFDWEARELHMTFDGHTDTVPLIPIMQDRLSVMYQFLFLSEAKSRDMEFDMTNGKKVEHYHYQLVGNETLNTRLGKIKTLHLAKQREGNESATEVWVAPERNLFPVKLLIIESDGTKYEQLITQLEFK